MRLFTLIIMKQTEFNLSFYFFNLCVLEERLSCLAGLSLSTLGLNWSALAVVGIETGSS